MREERAEFASNKNINTNLYIGWIEGRRYKLKGNENDKIKYRFRMFKWPGCQIFS